MSAKLLENPDPDLKPSGSRLFKDELTLETIRYVLEVQGLGVIVLRANRTNQQVKMCSFTNAEIG